MYPCPKRSLFSKRYSQTFQVFPIVIWKLRVDLFQPPVGDQVFTTRPRNSHFTHPISTVYTKLFEHTLRRSRRLNNLSPPQGQWYGSGKCWEETKQIGLSRSVKIILTQKNRKWEGKNFLAGLGKFLFDFYKPSRAVLVPGSHCLVWTICLKKEQSCILVLNIVKEI